MASRGHPTPSPGNINTQSPLFQAQALRVVRWVAGRTDTSKTAVATVSLPK